VILTVKKDGATYWYIIRDTAMYSTTHVGFSPIYFRIVENEFIVCTIGGTAAQEDRKKFQCKSKKQNWNDFDTDKVKSIALQRGRHWTGIIVFRFLFMKNYYI
jgi:hypothetical protein